MISLNNITVTEICDVFTVFSQKGRATTINNRKTYGLSFCIEGQITYTCNGTKYISDKDSAIILPQSKTYSLFHNKAGCFPVINFTCAEHLCDNIMVIPLQNTKPFIADFEQMKNLSLFDKNRSKLMSIFYKILHRLSLYDSVGEILIPAIKYIEKNYSDSTLSNTILAQECKISEIYFRRLFSEQLKLSPKQFLIDIRIQKAKQLLTEGNLTCNAIAIDCGFSNQSHFGRIFKARTGMTPTEYMMQNRIIKI